MEGLTYAVGYTDIEKVFEKWSLDYKKDPTTFGGEDAEDSRNGDSVAYGKSCANHFMHLLKEVWLENDKIS